MARGEISIAIYNCNGLEDYKKLSVFTWLKEKEYNISLQETRPTSLDEVNNFLSWTKELKSCDDIN